jgi:DNA polymerase (family 10)
VGLFTIIRPADMNAELSHAFERIADLLQITGADAFRVNSYRRVSRIIKDLADDITVLHKAGVIREIDGIGKATAAKIEEFIETGAIGLLAELSAQVPPGLPRLLEIPGMGPKKVIQVHAELGVKDLDDLKKAIEDGRLATLPGLGEQSVRKIAEGIAFLESAGGRTPRGLALPLADELARFLRSLPGVERVEIGGSLRRGAETIGDVDLVCASAEGQAVVEAFVGHPRVKRILAAGKTKGSVTVETEENTELQVDLRVVPAESFGAALQYFTGSKDHNVRLRTMATRRGWKLNEWGLFDGATIIAGSEEKDIYAALDLPLIPAEAREDRWEFDEDVAFDDLITEGDIRGDLHMHTTASDGRNSIAEMALAAKRLGYQYIAITDHSRSSTIANGLSVERLREHIDAIRRADAEIEGIKIFAGCECDILPNGALDYPDDLLAECDLVVASIHAAMGKGGGKGKLPPTERTLAAIENKYVTIIGHPTGRLIQRRPPMELDMAQVIAAAAATRTALEVNASWQRLDLKDLHVRQAILSGVYVAIDTDAHSADGLSHIIGGISTARRGGVRVANVVNAMPPVQLTRWIAGKRS